MTPRIRAVLLLLAALVIVPAGYRIAISLPAFGQPTARYGQIVNAALPAERHVANMVSAVNFDVRGFDTLGEEYMLLCAVTGAALLLRGSRGENTSAKAGKLPGRTIEPRSAAIVLVSRLTAPVIMLFGIYVVVHGTVTPGGGFQGGVVIASSLLLAYVGDGYRTWRKLLHAPLLGLMEGGGAVAFALAGIASMAMGGRYMENLLPLGKFKTALSGGLMLIENLAVGVAVTGGFAILFVEFLEETRSTESEAADGAR